MVTRLATARLRTKLSVWLSTRPLGAGKAVCEAVGRGHGRWCDLSEAVSEAVGEAVDKSADGAFVGKTVDETVGDAGVGALLV